MAELDDLFHLDQYVGPESLTELCYKVISENLDIISTKCKRGHRTLWNDLALPNKICDKIIEYVLRYDTIDTYDCFFTIFKNVTATKLKRVKIVRCNLTDQSVEILANHKLVELELTNCPNLTEYSIECINTNSENLRSLICHGTFGLILGEVSEYDKRGYVFKAPNLRLLALGYVSISPPEYNILLAGLPNLTHLDLSKNFDIGSLEFYHLVPNLVSLTLYNVKVNTQANLFVRNLCHLKKLRHLDISQSNPAHGLFLDPDKTLSDIVTSLPELMSLDIGGTNLAGIKEIEHSSDSENNDRTLIASNPSDIPGLASRVNRPLQFLGLYGTINGACRRHNIPAKLIAGDANEDQILVAAHVCMENKPHLLQKVLSDLYHVFRYDNCRRMDQALCTVLEAMEKHPFQIHIQISGSATLFYIVKMKEKGELEMRIKKRIVNVLLTGMGIYKDEETLLHNGCLTLCQFRIPQDVMPNYEALVKVLLHSVKHTKLDGFVQQIGIHILNTLACQVEGKEKRLLGKLGCLKTMLELVTYRVVYDIFDGVLVVAWSTMWNMTDETPINCHRFLSGNGMSLFLKCIKKYPRKEDLVRNMMGLLGNVAEVKDLRVHLMQHRYVTVFVKLLRSDDYDVEVSYNAAGTLAHMASDGVKAWTIDSPTRDEVLECMVEAIEEWDIMSERNINYRSFQPLLNLLNVYHTPQCQHWAVWALANLTKVYPSKYCPLVVKEGGLKELESIMVDPRPYDRIRELAQFVSKNCCDYISNCYESSAFMSSVEVECNRDD